MFVFVVSKGSYWGEVGGKGMARNLPHLELQRKGDVFLGHLGHHASSSRV